MSRLTPRDGVLMLSGSLYGGHRNGMCWACRKARAHRPATYWDENGEWCEEHAPEWVARMNRWDVRLRSLLLRWGHRIFG